MTAQLTVISWRDIPAQVTAKEGRTKARAQLSARFQLAIDSAAMASGIAGTDAYLEEWKRTTRPCGGNLEVEVQQEVEALEAAWTNARVSAAAKAGGVDVAKPEDAEAGA